MDQPDRDGNTDGIMDRQSPLLVRLVRGALGATACSIVVPVAIGGPLVDGLLTTAIRVAPAAVFGVLCGLATAQASTRREWPAVKFLHRAAVAALSFGILTGVLGAAAIAVSLADGSASHRELDMPAALMAGVFLDHFGFAAIVAIFFLLLGSEPTTSSSRG